MYSSIMNPSLYATSPFASTTGIFPWSQQQLWPLLQQQFGQQPWTSQQWNIANSFLSTFASRAPSGIFGSHHVPSAGAACAPGIASPVSPFTSSFGINPFSSVSGFGFHPDLAEIVKDLVVDRHRDVLQLETVHDLLDARCHGRPLDVVMAELASGVPVPIPILLQILSQERAVDHASDQVIRHVICDQVKNRKADEVISNILSGRRHLPRFDEEIEDWQNLAIDENIVARASQILSLVGCVSGVGAVNPMTSPYRTKKHLMALRQLATTGVSPLSGLANPLSQLTNPYINTIPQAYGSVFPFVSSSSVGGLASLGSTPFRPFGSQLASSMNLHLQQQQLSGFCPALPTPPTDAFAGLSGSFPISSLGGSMIGGLSPFQVGNKGIANSLLNPLAQTQPGLINPLINPLMQSGFAYPLGNPLVQGGLTQLMNPLVQGAGLVNPLVSGLAGGFGASSFGLTHPLANPMTSGLGNILRSTSASAFPLSSLSTVLGGIQSPLASAFPLSSLSTVLGGIQSPLASSFGNPLMASGGINSLGCHPASTMNPWMSGCGYPTAMGGNYPGMRQMHTSTAWGY